MDTLKKKGIFLSLMKALILDIKYLGKIALLEFFTNYYFFGGLYCYIQ